MMYFQVTVGRLLCGEVRGFLDAAKWVGHDIEWQESPGWIERTFTVKGNPESVRWVMQRLEHWRKSMEMSA
jgi:hypothetical protein